MDTVYNWEKIHLLGHRSNHAHASAIYYQMGSKSLHYKIKDAINLNLVHLTTLDSGDDSITGTPNIIVIGLCTGEQTISIGIFYLSSFQ